MKVWHMIINNTCVARGRWAYTKNIHSHPIVAFHPYTWEHSSQHYNNNHPIHSGQTREEQAAQELADIVAGECPFCGDLVIRNDGHKKKWINKNKNRQIPNNFEYLVGIWFSISEKLNDVSIYRVVRSNWYLTGNRRFSFASLPLCKIHTLFQ